MEAKLSSDFLLGSTLCCYKTTHFRRFIPKMSGCKQSICLPYGISSFLIIQPPKSWDEQCFIYCSCLRMSQWLLILQQPDENVLLSNLIRSQVTFRTFCLFFPLLKNPVLKHHEAWQKHVSPTFYVFSKKTTYSFKAQKISPVLLKCF